jgi:signal transduction histidine kinase
MSKEIVPLSPDDRKLLIEIAATMALYEEEIAQKWADLFVKSRNGLKESDRAIKNFKEAVWLLLTSLSDGDFDAYFNRIDEKGADFAKTKEQYENLILSFHLFEEATFTYLQRSFAERMKIVLTTLDHMYHNVIAILARAYFRGMEREREMFVNLLAHDLRNPLTVIIGFSGLIIERSREGTLAKDKEYVYLKKIMDSGATMVKLIDSILYYGKLKSGKFSLTISEFDVANIAREAASYLSTEAEKTTISVYINGHELREEMEELTPVMIMGDRDLILRAVGNYISNAVKYAQSRVVITIQGRDEDALISVEDDGPGIPANEINNIFQDYYMGQGGKPGTGLGLPSVRMVANLHSGMAWAESEEGKGSTFYLRLPKRQGT